MWHLWLNRNFMKLWEYFWCGKKTKIMTLFNNSSPRHCPLPFMSTTHACYAAHVTQACAAPCLQAEECTCMASWMAVDGDTEEKNCLIKSLFCFLCTQNVYTASQHTGWTTDVTMSLLPFWALNVVVPLLYMEGHKALGFHTKYLNLCSKDERRSYGFGTTWGWVINGRIKIFGWTIPLSTFLQENTFPVFLLQIFTFNSLCFYL